MFTVCLGFLLMVVPSMLETCGIISWCFIVFCVGFGMSIFFSHYFICLWEPFSGFLVG